MLNSSPLELVLEVSESEEEEEEEGGILKMSKSIQKKITDQRKKAEVSNGKSQLGTT